MIEEVDDRDEAFIDLDSNADAGLADRIERKALSHGTNGTRTARIRARNDIVQGPRGIAGPGLCFVSFTCFYICQSLSFPLLVFSENSIAFDHIHPLSFE